MQTVIQLPPSVRPRQGAQILGVGEATFWRYLAERADFPRPRRLSPRCTVFDTQELLDWRDAQSADTHQGLPAP